MINETAQKLKDAEHVSKSGKKELNVTQLLLIRQAIKEIELLTADRDHWRSLAERAMENLNEAMRILEGIQQAVHRD